MTTLDVNTLKFDKRVLHIPTLEEVKNIFLPALKDNFAETEVEIVECPDLTQAPFGLAAPGINGRLTVLDVGGPPFLLPIAQRNKIYDIQNIVKKINYGERVFAAGAGAGPWPYINSNCEMMMNVALNGSKVKNETHISSVNKTDGSCILETLKGNETRFALLANLFLCEGIQGKVLRVYAKKRTGSENFISTLQKALAKSYNDKFVGVGGTFLLKEGKAKQHIMSDFSERPLNTERDLNNWLQFYDMSAPLIAVGTFVSSEMDMDLRVQHFHSFSNHGEGGHYHYDTTPDMVEYLGYFNVAETFYRIDQPPSILTFGKD